MNREEKFYKALRDVFVGAKIEGESGFVNLMRIKSSYYEEVEKCIKRDIAGRLKDRRGFKEELFNKLYSFFNRYFTRSGSIYFNHTPFYHNIYEKIYTDEKDTVLFWKTRMLYYVKTDKILNNLMVELKGCKFYFDVSGLQYKRANEKRRLVYQFRNIRRDGVIVLDVSYSERGTKTKTDSIMKALKQEKIRLNEDILEDAFRTFEKQSEVDYFINKDARSFLKEQFKLWLYQYYFDEENEWPKERIDQMQTVKDIAYNIIDFIAQFEDELVKIWNKPKFVRNSNYVITLDRILEKDSALIEKLIAHKGFAKQVKEWEELKIIEDGSKLKKTGIVEKTLYGKKLKKEYRCLPIDTGFFKDLEIEIISLFENLDESLDGWLIKSENYQALNTISPKFRERVQTIYIDPPFNTGSDFDYVDRFQDSTWLTLMENRMRLGKELLSDKGVIFLHLDHNANYFGRVLLNGIFGDDNFRNEIVWRRQIPRGMKAHTKFLPFSADYIFLYVISENAYYNQLTKRVRLTIKEAEKKYLKDEKGFFRTSDPGTYSFESLLKLYSEDRLYAPYGGKIIIDKKNKTIKAENGNLSIKYYRKQEGKFIVEESSIDNIWDDIPGLGIVPSEWQGFYTQKPEALLRRIINSTSNRDDLILDFFLGSGTTTAVAHKLERKWLGVEMGGHFYDVALPRMKRVLSGEQSGISKDVKWQGGGFFKYYELEQYEDTLRKAKYEDSALFEMPGEDAYSQYVFLKDKKLLDGIELDYRKNKIKVKLEKLYPDIDIAETLSNLLGKPIKKITAGEVEFANGEKIDIKNLDYKLIKPLVWW